jgi:hypothetical protein
VKIKVSKLLFAGVLVFSLAQNSWPATFVGTGGGHPAPDRPLASGMVKKLLPAGK